MTTRRLSCCALALLAACDSATVPPRQSGDVYDFRLPSQPPQVLRWPSGSTVRLFAAGGNVPAQASALGAALSAGVAAWNRHALFGEYRLATTTDLGAADVVLRWSGDVSPVDLSECLPVGTRAVTTFCAEDDDLANGLAVFPRVDGGNSRVKMVVTILPSQLPEGRVQALVTHELGHVLGVAGHSGESRDLMYAGELVTAVPSRRDQATVQLLYQMRPDVVP